MSKAAAAVAAAVLLLPHALASPAPAKAAPARTAAAPSQAVITVRAGGTRIRPSTVRRHHRVVHIRIRNRTDHRPSVRITAGVTTTVRLGGAGTSSSCCRSDAAGIR